jgi:diguanylate cyclase (GGDEF)-like protein
MVQEAFRETVRTGQGHRLTFRFILPDRSVHYMESNGSLIRDETGGPCHVVVVSRDITERVVDEQRIRELAYHDPLTQLPNRRLLEDRVDQALAASERSGHYGALLLLDLDHFKALNDEYGHALGDALLVQASRRAVGSVRKTDTVARLGGDEFVVVLGSLDADAQVSRTQAELLAEKLRTRLGKPYRLKARNGDGEERSEHIEHRCTVSIGATLFCGRAASIDDLMERADRAMYDAKQAGSNRVCFAD